MSQHRTDLARRHGRRSARLFIAAAVLTSGLAAATSLSQAAAVAAPAATPAPRGVQIQPPANAMAGTGVTLTAVSCVRPKTCGATGQYVDKSGDSQVMVVSEANGHWARGQELKLPKGAPKQPDAAVNSISCTAAGSCTAGGSYSVGGNFFGFVAAESHGSWGQARKLGPPPDAPQSNYVILAVSCTGAGSCTAIGGFRDSHGTAQLFAVTQKGGSWGKAAKLTLPANASANPGALAFGVSCAVAGSCVTVGEYNTKTVEGAFAATESAGKWHPAVEIKLPKGTNASSSALAQAVSCPVPGGCVVVGEYNNALGNDLGFTLTENKGHWRRAATFTKLPSNAAPHPEPQLTGVTCPVPGSCMVVGNYTVKSGGGAAFAGFRHGGHWLGSLQVLAPHNAAAGLVHAFLTGASCDTTPFCAAVGYYVTKAGQNAAMGAALQLPAASG